MLWRNPSSKSCAALFAPALTLPPSALALACVPIHDLSHIECQPQVLTYNFPHLIKEILVGKKYLRIIQESLDVVFPLWIMQPMKEKTKPKCLNPNCDNKSKVRGLCAPCYQVAQYAVARKLTSWEKLEKEKKVLKAYQSNGGRRGGPVVDWILS